MSDKKGEGERRIVQINYQKCQKKSHARYKQQQQGDAEVDSELQKCQ